jgi:LAS superfamily LD-carboxypeptidase LdcB
MTRSWSAKRATRRTACGASALLWAACGLVGPEDAVFTGADAPSAETVLLRSIIAEGGTYRSGPPRQAGLNQQDEGGPCIAENGGPETRLACKDGLVCRRAGKDPSRLGDHFLYFCASREDGRPVGQMPTRLRPLKLVEGSNDTPADGEAGTSSDQPAAAPAEEPSSARNEYCKGGARNPNPADLLLLLNKRTDGLTPGWKPAPLVDIAGSLTVDHPSRAFKLRSDASEALARMFADARGDGHNLLVVSAYRSFEDHCENYLKKLADRSVADVAATNAKPGWSGHQLGTSVDITSQRIIDEEQRKPANQRRNPLRLDMGPEGQWLVENAHRFGFILAYPQGQEQLTGHTYEPWHYRYVGTSAAAAVKSSGKTLDECLERWQSGFTNSC